MSHLPAIPQVIVLDFLPTPAELPGLIADRLPGLAASPVSPRKAVSEERRSPRIAREEVLILLDYLPSLSALEGVIRGRRTDGELRPQRGGAY